MRFCHIVGVIVGLVAGCQRTQPDSGKASSPQRIIVFAAASATDVMREAGRRFEEACDGVTVMFSFDSSSSLARQIRAGAPAEVFLSADERWMDDVEAAGALRAGSRSALLGNTLVLIAPSGGPRVNVEMSRDFPLVASNPHVKRFALGDPAHVPAGRYARHALESLGWWGALQPLLIPAQDVRAALRLVEMGEADAGIVYATDAASSQKVTVVGEFPGDAHEPIRYPVALCHLASENAAEFLRFLRSPEMGEVFQDAGFRVLSMERDASPHGGG